MSLFSPQSAQNTSPIGDIFSSLIVFFLTVAIAFLAVDAVVLVAFDDYEFVYAVNTQLYMFFDVAFTDIYETNSKLYYTALGGLALGIFAGVVAAIYTYIYTTPDAERHISGRRKLESNEAVKQFLESQAKEQKWGGTGLTLIETDEYEELTISEDRETKHLLFAGGIGSGKTTILRPIIDRSRERDDIVFIFDNKSDYTKTCEDFDDIHFVAPWDVRGAKWLIAVDIRTRSDAEAYAANLIAENEKDPMWSNSARALLVAIIVDAQRDLKLKWSFVDITEALSKDTKRVKEIVENLPEYSLLVEDTESKTLKSVIINLIAFLSPIFRLTDAYDRCQTSSSFSIRDWIHGRGKKTLMLQGNGEEEPLQIALSKTIFNLIKRQVTSPRMTDVKPKDRRIYMFLDEFKQLGKLDGFAPLVEVGRSKGVRLAVAIQDISQLKEVYGSEVTTTWLSSFGTYIVGKLNGADTSEWLGKMFGKRRVKRYQPSYSNDGQSSVSRTDQYTEEELPVVRQEEFASKLGPDSTGVNVLVFTGDDYVYQLHPRHLDEDDELSEKREAIIPARWTQDDWPSAEDVAKANIEAEAAYDE